MMITWVIESAMECLLGAVGGSRGASYEVVNMCFR